MLKRLSWPEIITGILLTAGGLILLFIPQVTLGLIAMAIGGLFIFVGLIFVLCFFVLRKVASGNIDLVKGVVAILIGVFICLDTELVVSILPVILGICMALSGILKLQRAFDLHRMRFDSWLKVLITALINILIGLLVVMNPFETAQWLMRLIGAGFIFSGISDLVTTFYVAHKASAYYVKAEVLEPEDSEVVVSIEDKDLPVHK